MRNTDGSRADKRLCLAPSRPKEQIAAQRAVGAQGKLRSRECRIFLRAVVITNRRVGP
jgi:hypothetical protein